MWKMVLNNKSFPKVVLLSQFKKMDSKKVDTRISKWLKPFVMRKDVIVSEDMLAINVGCWVCNKTLDKSRIIKMLRECYELNHNLSFYGWNSLMIGLDLRYGSKESIDKTRDIMNFVIKHVEAYQEALGEEPNFEPKEFPENLAEFRLDHILCKDNSGESCYSNMWKYIDDSYVVYDDFLKIC